MGRVDAHCHFWDPARGDYRWLATGPKSLDPLRRPFGPEELLALNGGCSLIAIQAADSVEETRYLLSLAKEFPAIKGVVGWLDLCRPRSVETLRELSRDHRFKGVRPMLQDIPEDDWIATRPDRAVVQALLEKGLRFDALVLTRHLKPLARFVASWRDLPVIVDHCAKPKLAYGFEGPDPDWLQGMRILSSFSQVHCKLSGLLTELPNGLQQPEAAFAAMRPVLTAVLEFFGPKRLIWGSDWPVLTLCAEYRVWEELTDRLLECLSLEERAAVLGGNAMNFYGIRDGHD